MLINKILETKNESRKRFIKIRKQKIIMNWVLTISTTGFIIFALLFAFKKINLNSQEFIIGLLIYLFFVLIFIGFHFYIFKTNNLYKKFVTLYDQEEIKTEVLEELTIKRKKKFESKHTLKLDQQKNLEKKRINKLKHTQEMTQIKTEAALVEEQNLESEIELEKIRERVALKRANIEKMIMDYLNTLKQDLNSQNTTQKQKYTSTTQIKLIQLENNLKNASDNDFYSILGITKDAEFEDIKKAFKNKAKQYHPDLNMGDDTYFIKIKNAYENILKENDLNNE